IGIAEGIAPEGDVMTEVLRRLAQLQLEEENLCEAQDTARKCIRLSRKIEDKHERGAALRILGDIHAAKGRTRKALSAYEESMRLLRSAKENYELMRSCISMASFLIGMQKESAGVHLLEAKHLASKTGLDYFAARIMVLMAKHAVNMRNHAEARAYLRKAQKICGALNGQDGDTAAGEIAAAYRELDKAIVVSSIDSAEKLKILGKIYEEARFPVEEAGPRMATEIARNVNAESLFVVRKRNGGYRIPLKYNIASDKAKRIARRLDNGGGKRLFGAKQPRICDIGSGKKLLSVSGPEDGQCALCMIIDGDRSLSQQDMEFLLASYEAIGRVAEEQTERCGRTETDAFGDGPVAHPGGSFKSIITVDSQMIRLLNLAERASRTDVPILLQGETGVGKELVTRAIHDASARREKACTAINTGGIPVHFLESELFGYMKGAFTDARMDKPGLVEHACGGTLFLDEIGDMSEEIQVKLLRLIENGEYRRLGEAALRHANVRIISATNKDLTDLVNRGKFREDLFYRLSTVRFTIPALRYRRGDIGLLVRHLLKHCLQKLHMPDRAVEMDAKTMEAFELYDWPGNIRELQNEIMRLVSLLGSEHVIRFHMLSDAIQRYFKNHDRAGLHEDMVGQYERRLIIQALEANDWNRLKAAEEMGIPRTTLLAKMRRLNITS
ncbi:MAG: sigma 54-interacting transcriptional regulator, partial [Chitinivibrionia bacterium]|nr:sigma 54-interacting transcriptional regulator [Chitinivibrionia bacterium]